MSENKGISPCAQEETTTLRGIACGGTGGSLAHIDSKDGKIVRIRPMRWDEKYTAEELEPRTWKFTSRGLEFACPEVSMPNRIALAYKNRVYSKNRVLKPLKRIDWEPGGDPEKINAHNRGRSKYVEISWDEAAKLVADEIKRVADTYGPNSLFQIGEDGHKESKDIHSGGGWHTNLMIQAYGDYTREVRTPDSVEGWYWGSKHVWGSGCYMGLGMAAPSQNIIKDVSDHTELIMLQSGDWECTQNYATNWWSRVIRYWLDLGIKMVVIDPFCNYTAVCHDEIKWVPITANTDAAFDFAIMYTWITEDTYDHEYMDTHVIGFEKVKAYILGEEDGIPKTPKWASEKCGVAPWTIKAIARAWAKHVTSVGHYCGCHIRGPYSHEPARTETYKLAMQGLGKPGQHQIHLFSWQVTWPKANVMSETAPLIMGQRAAQFIPKDQQIPRTMVHHAIKNEKIEWWGSPQIIYALADEQFEKYEYPIPEDEDGARVHFLWSEKPCNQSCWNGGFEFQDAIRSPEVECFVTNHQWMENDSIFADIVLPVSTCLEEFDDMGCSQNDMVVTAALCDKACEPLGESMSDYEIAQRVADEFGLRDALTQGMSVEEWIEFAFNKSAISAEISWEEFKERGYYLPENREDWAEIPAGQANFYNDPEEYPLDTPSGKMEFYSEALAENFPEDKERQPIAKWIEGGPAEEGWSHDESPWGERAKSYPLVLVSNPGKWRVHVQGDDIAWYREIETCKVKGADGYRYEPLWINPVDAAARGIEDGDILKLFNDRGTIWVGARVTERMIPGCVMLNKGSRTDPIDDRLDRGGNANLICPAGPISKHCWGFVVTGYLVETQKIEQAEYDENKAAHPEVWARDYDDGFGLTRNAWVEGE